MIQDQTTQSSMYCRQCDYQLHGLSEHRCPECGRRFDPADAGSFLSQPRSRSGWHWLGWAVAAGCGPAAGLLLGLGFNASYRHGMWPILAGVVVGITSGLAARSHAVRTALGSGVIAVTVSVVTVTVHMRRIGYWPITNEFTIEHYGTATMAAMRLAVGWLFLVCVPLLVASAAIAFARRLLRPKTAFQHNPAEGPRGLRT